MPKKSNNYHQVIISSCLRDLNGGWKIRNIHMHSKAYFTLLTLILNKISLLRHFSGNSEMELVSKLSQGEHASVDEEWVRCFFPTLQVCQLQFSSSSKICWDLQETRPELPGALQKLEWSKCAPGTSSNSRPEVQPHPRPIKSKSTFQENHLDKHHSV